MMAGHEVAPVPVPQRFADYKQGQQEPKESAGHCCCDGGLHIGGVLQGLQQPEGHSIAASMHATRAYGRGMLMA